MKRIMTFEKMYSDPKIEAELGNIPNDGGDITPVELQFLLDDILQLDNMEEITKKLVNLKYKYDIPNNPNPEIKRIWGEGTKIWHGLFKTLGEPPANLMRTTFELPNDTRKYNL
jgi:hypothetical protein